MSRDFAWRFWTSVENWAAVDPSVEWVQLDGPFAAGARGRTKPQGAGPTRWTISEVQEGRGAVIEVAAPGALLRFFWDFEESAGGTRITQRVSLEGVRAGDYTEAMREFEAGIPAGMGRLGRAMAEAARRDD